MTIAPRFMGELPARAGSDAIHRPIRRAFLNKTQPHQAVTRSVPDWRSWRDRRNINGLAVPFLNPVPGIPRSCFLRSWSGIPGFQNRGFLPNTLNYRANSDRPPFLVPDLRSWKKVNEFKGFGFLGLPYIYIYGCVSGNTPILVRWFPAGPGYRTPSPHPRCRRSAHAAAAMHGVGRDGRRRQVLAAHRPSTITTKEHGKPRPESRDGWRRRSWKFPAATLTRTTPIEGVHHGSRNSAQECAA